MKCKKVKLISKYFDKQTSSDENKILFEHLNICPYCKKEFDFFRKIFSNLSNNKSLNLNPYFNQKLKSHIKNTDNIIRPHIIALPIRIFASLIILFFILSFSLTKIFKTNYTSLPHKNFYEQKNVATPDEDEVILGLIDLVEEINNKI